MGRMAGCVVRARLAYAIVAGFAAIAAGYVSPSAASEPQTTVLWYGAGCKDENGAHLEYGDLVQFIRSRDEAADPPDGLTGEPTGDDVVAATAVYQYPPDLFQPDDWSEKEGCYVYVRIWNAAAAASGTYYRDSTVRQATGMLPIDIDCSGMNTGVAKGEAAPTEPPVIPSAPVLSLDASGAEVGAGDVFSLDLVVSDPIVGGGNVAMYLVVQTPEGLWMSFVPGRQGGAVQAQAGIMPAMAGSMIPAITRQVLNARISESLARGEYRFAAAVFNAGDPITLENWRSLALHSAETVVIVR